MENMGKYGGIGGRGLRRVTRDFVGFDMMDYIG